MSPSPPRPVEFRLLGPVEAVRDDAPLALGGARQRTLLALLLLSRGRPVTPDRLVEDLWRGSPPPAAATTLRSYVSRLRSVLGGDVPLRATLTGYSLDVDPRQVDAYRFELLADEGGTALAQGSAPIAADRLREALSLWRGKPLAGVADDGPLRLEAERLEQRRELALEERVDAELALGRGPELIAELELLVREQPYRERRWRQLMLALYRAERQADALAAARRARAILRDEVGLEPSDELRRLEQGILRHELSPAAAPESLRVALPMTTFVGRTAELREIDRLLAQARLVTLTGVGGVGKTRLAIEAAARETRSRPVDVAFVDFSALADPRLVPRRLADALDVQEHGGATTEDSLVARLQDDPLLLVLDNCEHVRDAAAALVRVLLTACAPLRILATSREPLGLAGEVDYPVPPLAVPSPDGGPEGASASEAVELFLARAREVRPGLPADAAALEAAGGICRDLDGLPLAIELAAARAKALSLDEIRARLADRFRFLVSWRRLTDARHRTLREAIDWSYDLLRDDERTLLARLSVFAGGFTLDAAASVCADDDEMRAEHLVARLVDASLVAAGELGGTMRYRLLETVRQYAAERLEATAEADAITERHAAWALALAEEAEPELAGDAQTQWFSVLEAEHDNLRAALGHLAATRDAERRLRLTIALTRFWYVRGHLAEARARLEDALADADGQPVAIRRRAVTAAAAVALLQGDYAVSAQFAEQALDLARATGEARYVPNALSNLGAILLAGGDHARAGEILEEAVALAREVDDDRIAALAINNLGDHALTVGEYARAEPLFAESLAMLRARGDTANVARSLFNLGAVALELGRPDDARARLRESLAYAEEAGDKEDLAWCLEGAAALAAHGGRATRAARLLGAAEGLLETMGAAFKPFERRLHDTTAARASALCGEAAVADAMRIGAASTLPEALADARVELGA